MGSIRQAWGCMVVSLLLLVKDQKTFIKIFKKPHTRNISLILTLDLFICTNIHIFQISCKFSHIGAHFDNTLHIPLGNIVKLKVCLCIKTNI